MTVLSSKKILQEKNTTDPNSITSLTLTHKALSDVSCLSEFKNLERLDLGFNSLTSLEDLKSCVNLKWLSVVQNKLQSLKGIESLTNLTVLNAGKNKLKSMDEVKSLGSLRALILNDNEITSVCKLDQMKELNTLVLSRNPIRSLGESLVKLKSITKLSLSNCQLQTVDSSLKSCLELKELRLSHNEIMSIPSEFGHFMKLQNLDVGNNWITNWSNLKVLSSLVNLRNLNLQGNPVAEKENLLKKVKKLLPNLHIFNSRPIEKFSAKEVHGKVDDFSVEEDNKSTLRSKSKTDHLMRDKMSSKSHPVSETMDGHLDNAGDLGSRNKRKEPHDEKGIDLAKNADTSENKKKKNYTEALDVNTEKEKKQKLKKQKDRQPVDEPVKKSRKTLGGDHKVNMIDTADTPFMDLFTTSAHEVALKTTNSKLDRKTDQGFGVVVLPKKKTKKNRAVDPAFLDLSRVDEIGLGGPSAW